MRNPFTPPAGQHPFWIKCPHTVVEMTIDLTVLGEIIAQPDVSVIAYLDETTGDLDIGAYVTPDGFEIDALAWHTPRPTDAKRAAHSDVAAFIDACEAAWPDYRDKAAREIADALAEDAAEFKRGLRDHDVMMAAE